jgi:hypothetical protein
MFLNADFTWDYMKIMNGGRNSSNVVHRSHPFWLHEIESHCDAAG